MKFNDLLSLNYIYLYAGDIPLQITAFNSNQRIGLSLYRADNRHIKHDITNKHDLPDNRVDIYQVEDVMEHIKKDKIILILNDLYRILKPGGLFRLSMPDYRCDLLIKRNRKDSNDEIIFDPGGGGVFKDGKVCGGGHLWFPKYEIVYDLLNHSNFSNLTFLHYYDIDNKPVIHSIDYSLGYISRTPDHDRRVQNPYRPLSIVVDCYKEKGNF
jgi:SAM-dependent methyltransferase